MKKRFIFVILSSLIAFIFLIAMPKIKAALNLDIFSTLDILSPNETPNFTIIENNTTIEINNPDKQEYTGKRISEYKLKVLGDNGADIVLFEFLQGENRAYTKYTADTLFELDGSRINPSKKLKYLNPSKTAYRLDDCYDALKENDTDKIDISEIENSYYTYKITVKADEIKTGGYIKHKNQNHIFGDDIMQDISTEEDESIALFLKPEKDLVFYYLTAEENNKEFELKSIEEDNLNYTMEVSTIQDYLKSGYEDSRYDEKTYFNLRAQGLKYVLESNSNVTNLSVDNMSLLKTNTIKVNKAKDEQFTLKIESPIYYSLDDTSDPFTYDYKYIINPYLHINNTEVSYGKLNLTIKTPNYVDNQFNNFKESTEGNNRIYKISIDSFKDISDISFKVSPTETYSTKQQILNSQLVFVVAIMFLIFVLFLIPVLLNLLSITNIGSFKDYFLPISALFMMSIVACATYSILNFQAIGVIFGFSIAYTIATIVDFITTRRIAAIPNTLLGLAIVIFVSVGRVYNYNFNYVFILSIVAASICYIYLWIITVKKLKLYLVVFKENRKKKKELKLQRKLQKKEQKQKKKEIN